MHKLTEKHEIFLESVVGISVDEFKHMSQEDLSDLVDNKLMWLECDGVDNKIPNGISEEGAMAADIIDIIYGPYDGSKYEEA